ncbi:pilus assembly protein N-terminal domain-containing protein [Alsobacter sp. R-9]
MLKRSLGILLAASVVATTPAVALDAITVKTDHAQVLKLPPRTNTIIIGNPMIADVSVQKNGSMVVTGKSYGTTNLIAQDSTGAVIGESIIKVEAPTEDTLVLQRGLERETYSCTPKCQPTLSLGDVQRHFDGVSGQTANRNGLAK